MSFWMAKNKLSKQEIWICLKSIGDHVEYLQLSILAFTFIKAIQDDDDWFTRALALKIGKWLNNELPELDKRGIL
jgi:hypothetical protein